MKKILILIILTLSVSVALAQTKDTFALKSIPTYDEFGNCYRVIKQYDHVPTTQDSASFVIESSMLIHHMIDSIANLSSNTYIKKKAIYKHDKTRRPTKRSSK